MEAILYRATPNVVKRFAYMERKLGTMKLPKIEPPFRVYLYEEKKTQDNEEHYDDGDEIFRQKWWEHYDKVVGSGICWSKFYDGYGIGNMILKDFVFYDKPKELSEFDKSKITKQWCYVEELENV